MASSAAAAFGSELTAELHDYLKEKNLNKVFVSLVEAVLTDKPGNPIGYMTNYLLEKFPAETQEISDRLTGGGTAPPRLVVAQNGGDESSDTGSECSSFITEESIAPTAPSSGEKMPVRKKRRESVFAEKIDDCVVADSELKVTAKAPAEAARISQILRSNVFFGHLDEHQRRTIQNVMFGVDKEDGDVIIRQGDDGDNFYILDRGTVEVFLAADGADGADGGAARKVKTCEAGDAFGELAIMYNAPRAASCVAKGSVRLWALDRVSFNVVLRRTAIARRERRTEILQGVPVFAQLTPYERLTMADALRDESFEDGAVVCRQGDRGDRFYLVEGGTAVCAIARADGTDVEVARLSAGSYFGEIALLTTKTRQATVTAGGDLKCLSLDRSTFNRLNGPLQDIMMRNTLEYNKIRASII